eukprot:Em0003g925a
MVQSILILVLLCLNKKSRERRGSAQDTSPTTRTMTQAAEGMDSSNINLLTLKRMVQTLQKLNVITKLDKEIFEGTTEEDGIRDEIEQADLYRERVELAIIPLQFRIWSDANLTTTLHLRCRHVIQPNVIMKFPRFTTSRATSQFVTAKPEFETRRVPKVKLPKVSSKFNGEITRINYLHSLLEGTAADAISGLSLTATSIAEAIAILKMRSLKSLGVPSESYGSLLSSILMKRLPQELSIIVSRPVGEDSWNLDKLMIFGKEVGAREQATDGDNFAPTEKPAKANPTTAALLAVQISSYMLYLQQMTPFQHLLQIDPRHESIKPIALSVESSPQPLQSMQTSTVSMYIDMKNPVLLQTATATVYSANRPNNTTIIRLVLDSGSQKSYITIKLRDSLRLPREQLQAVTMKTFGSQGTDFELSMFTVLMICELLSRQPINWAVKRFPYLQGLDVADSCDSRDALEMSTLIGVDQYWKRAYAAVVYLKMRLVDKHVVRFVVSRTRVAPLSTQLIPRLELLAALLLSRLLSSVAGALEPECKDFSTLKRLLKVMALVVKLVVLLRSRVKSEETFMHHEKFNVQHQQLAVFYDKDGVWRCKVRLHHADLPESTKHPILLDKVHCFTTLIVRDCHTRVMHGGVKATITELRSRFWVVKRRQFVQRLIHECKVCKQFNSKPIAGPPPPPLPDFRTQVSPLFSFTGVDYIGPLYLKNSDKKWICHFTCCVVQAIHLELIPDLTAEAFVRCLRRFMARHGISHMIDCKTFRSASNMVTSLLDMPEMQQHFKDLHIQWMFILEKAPWWGGFYERMVQLMKKCLLKVIGQAKLSHDKLFTVLVEVEAMLNSRPISYVSSDNVDEPLTPSHLLVGCRLLNLPDSETGPDFGTNPDRIGLTQRMIYRILYHFWKKWKAEYLTSLQEPVATQGTHLVIPVNGENEDAHSHHPRRAAAQADKFRLQELLNDRSFVD